MATNNITKFVLSAIAGAASAATPIGDLPLTFFLEVNGVENPRACLNAYFNSEMIGEILYCYPLSLGGLGLVNLEAAVLIGVGLMAVVWVIWVGLERMVKQ